MVTDAATSDSNCIKPKPASRRPCALKSDLKYDFDTLSPCNASAVNAAPVLFHPDVEGEWRCWAGNATAAPYSPVGGHAGSALPAPGNHFFFLDGSGHGSHFLDGPLINASDDSVASVCNVTFWLYGNAPLGNTANLNDFEVQMVWCGNESDATVIHRINTTAYPQYPSSSWHEHVVVVPVVFDGLYRIRWAATLSQAAVTGGGWAIDDVTYGAGCVPAYANLYVIPDGGDSHWPAGLIFGVIAGVICGAFVFGAISYGLCKRA